jgi:hypothetical protein
MYPEFVRVAAPLALVCSLASGAYAQSPALTLDVPALLAASGGVEATSGQAAGQPVVVTDDEGDWQFAVYPILAWIPLNIGIEVTGPFDNGGDGGSGGGGGGEVGGKIVDKRFDGAFLAGFTATNGTWRFAFDGVYAAVGGDRVTPNLTVDVNLIYAHATVEREIAGGFFVTGGVRRFALKYDVEFLDYETFTRKPGIWDPLVGVAYHKLGDVLQFHAHAEYGGFGIGSDQDLGVGARVDWKPWDHFGFTAGYSLVNFKFKEDIGPYEFTAKQTVGGPVVGIGLYF